jgi:hypothetical protein
MTQLELPLMPTSCHDEVHVVSCDTWPLCECGKMKHPLDCSYDEAAFAIKHGNEQYGKFLEESGEEDGHD